MFNPFPHIGSLFSSAVHFLPGMFTSKYLKCLMMYSGLLAINYPILSTQNRDFHIHPHIPCFFKPIYGDDWGMVHYCFNHINLGKL